MAWNRRGEIGLLAVCLLLFFWRLGAARLFDMDEGFYVSCARVMAGSGDWITPRLNVRPHGRPAETTVPFYEKPILTYWAAAAAIRAFGNSETAARIPAALASLAATLLIVWAGIRWVGRRAALLAGLVYATAPMVMVDARQMTTDALLTLWFLVAMVAYRERKPFLFSAACALAVLTKGVIGILLPGLVIGVLHATRIVSAGWNGRREPEAGESRSTDRLQIGLALLLFLAITVPWHIAILKAGGIDANGRNWVQEYVIRQHVGRFKGEDIHHNAPIFTYLGYFLIGFFPWACFTPFAFRYPPRRDSLAATCAPGPDDQPAQNRRFLLCWFWTIFVFFSLSAAKLPTYIVPAYPAAALMVGVWLDRIVEWTNRATRQAGRRGDESVRESVDAGWTFHTPHRSKLITEADVADLSESQALSHGLRVGATAALITATLVLVAALLVPAATRSRQVMPEAIADLTIMVSLVTAAGCFIAWICLRRAGLGAKWARAGIGTYACMMAALVCLAAGPGYILIDRWLLRPYQDLAALARDDASRGNAVIFYQIGDRRPSMLYYARDYSPFERKEAPLLPFLARVTPSSASPVDVITLRKSFERQLRSELDSAHWAVEELARRDSGLDTWLLLRIHPPQSARR